MKNVLALALLFSAAVAAAQEKADVTVTQVNDRRSREFFSELTLILELPKLQSSEVAASRVFLSRATDDLGNDLLDPDASEPEFEGNPRAMMNDAAAMPAAVSVRLENPARKAKKIAAVNGEIELYMPGRDPHSLAEIPKFVTLRGAPLDHRALAANGVGIEILTVAQVDEERKRRAGAKKKEYEEMGYSGQDLEYMLEGSLTGMLGEATDLVVRIEDPEGRIQEIGWIDAAGEAQMVSMREDEGLFVLSSWAGEPQPDWTMRVSMRTPKNVVRYAFALENVPLP